MVFNVMVVDDDLPTLEVMNLILKKIGYEPVLYRNGLEALQWLERHHPDLILLDLQMIPIDGWEFLRRLREDRSDRSDEPEPAPVVRLDDAARCVCVADRLSHQHDAAVDRGVADEE